MRYDLANVKGEISKSCFDLPFYIDKRSPHFFFQITIAEQNFVIPIAEQNFGDLKLLFLGSGCPLQAETGHVSEDGLRAEADEW